MYILNCRGGIMKTIQKRFYLFALLLTGVVVIGLITQYSYLNKIIIETKESNME